MKLIRLFILLLMPAFVCAQQSASTKPDAAPIKILVRDYMIANKTNWKLTETDIENWIISDLYSNKKTGTTYVYVHQQVKDIRIFNAVSSISVKNGMIKSFAKRLHSNAFSKINTNTPANSPTFAIQKTAAHLGLNPSNEIKFLSSDKASHKKYYSSPALSKDKIRVQLVFQPVEQRLRLAWDVSLHLIDGSHWWNVRIDAVNGEVLQKNDWTKHCDFGTPEEALTTTPLFPQNSTNSVNQSSLVPTYRVFPLPLEAPHVGPSALLADPADATASPFGWHDTNGASGAEFNITRGNNVFAYDDIANVDAPGTSANGTATLTFDFPANLSQPSTSYLNASVTNLFYVNNFIHDVLYHYGFDEAAGNFQENNYGNGGAGQDYVIAECQDGGGSNNANFSTPDDGQNGRMQMYLWSGAVQSLIEVNSPAPIAGNYTGIGAGFGPAVNTQITANLVLVDDGTGTTSDACEPLVNGPALSGKIALIDRGTCTFVDKVLSAQNEGAVAVLVINNSPGLLSMGDNGNGASVTIPSLMISQTDGALIKNSLITGAVNATLNPPPTTAVDIDGSFDNGIIVHEYGHGVSNRLTGGPMNSNCLFNGEQGGEGWSDFFTLMFTIKPGDVGSASRSIGTFALGQPVSGFGIRRYPYSTDMNINPETYGLLAQSPQVHDIGEVWCSALWDMNWGLIAQFGIDPDWINGTSGNNITMKLVIEGMKLQPCGPGFLDARDAILQADDNIYGGIHKCIIWEAFAKRGMGFNADQGDADIAGDETEDFSLPPLCLTPVDAPSANFNADVTNTCFGVVHFNDLSTDIPQSWSWNFGDGTTSTLQNPTHTYLTTGTFNVTLIVTNTLGDDTLVRASYITVSRPSSTLITGDTIVCNGTSAALTSSFTAGNQVEWRDAADSILFTGSVFNTPGVFSNTTYYVSQYSPTPIQNVGPVNNSFGTGGFHNSSFEGKLFFTALAPMRLKSVLVDAGTAATRTINIYGPPSNTLIESKSVFIPAGQSRVVLNIDITSSGAYQIGVAAGSNLYRNNSGATYPYLLSGLVSITGSNSTQNPAIYYYYLYDWEVQPLPCTSTPVPVNVSVDPDPTSNFTSSATGLTVQFTNTSSGNPISYLWNFGNGDTSTQMNPSITYSMSGAYTVSLTLTSSNGCQSTRAQLISVAPVGVEEVSSDNYNIYLTGKDLVIKFESQPVNAQIRVYDTIGKLLLNTNFSGGKLFNTKLENIPTEFLLVDILDGEESFSKKVFLHR